MNIPLAVVLGLLAVPAGASAVSDAQDNFETVVRSHVAAKSDDGVWLFKRPGGKVLRLTLEKVERPTVHRAAAGRWNGLVDFKDRATGTSYAADATVDTGSDLWKVSALHWLTRDEAAKARAADVKAAQASSMERAPGPAGLLPELSLPSMSGRETFLPDCPKAKCLTVVVAPWCPHCRNVTEVITKLQTWLPAHGVAMRVIVWKDDDQSVRDYAKTFGPDTLLDPGAILAPGGVPAFIISTDGGAILKKTNGAWEDEKDPEKYAALLELP